MNPTADTCSCTGTSQCAGSTAHESNTEKKKKKEKLKQRRHPTEAVRWFAFDVSVFCFIILHNGRTWVFYADLSLCFVKLNLRSQSFSFGWLSISTLKQRMLEPFRQRFVWMQQHLLEHASRYVNSCTYSAGSKKTVKWNSEHQFLPTIWQTQSFCCSFWSVSLL